MKNNSDFIENALGKNNIKIDELKRASESGSVQDYIDKKLPPDAGEKIKQILSDKNATEKILSSPQAKKLLEQLRKKQGSE